MLWGWKHEELNNVCWVCSKTLFQPSRWEPAGAENHIKCVDSHSISIPIIIILFE